jgi:hypothetical protein
MLFYESGRGAESSHSWAMASAIVMWTEALWRCCSCNPIGSQVEKVDKVADEVRRFMARPPGSIIIRPHTSTPFVGEAERNNGDGR